MFGVRRNLRAKERDGSVKKGFMQIHEMDSKSKIKSGSNDLLINPEEQMIIMYGCYLHNSASRAQKIFDGEIYKERCAWVTCESYEVVDIDAFDHSGEITYNPKVSPFFDLDGENVDKQEFDIIVMADSRLFIV
jgi:hypothetical protein